MLLRGVDNCAHAVLDLRLENESESFTKSTTPLATWREAWRRAMRLTFGQETPSLFMNLNLDDVSVLSESGSTP